MFYYLVRPIVHYNFLLIAAAVIPAIALMIRVYQADHLEKESPALLYTLVKAGILSSLLALVEEKIFSSILNQYVEPNTVKYNLILYFCVVAISEESSKYIFLRKNSWNHPEFNCQYDGVIYAVFVSLGFALWENISYVLNYGFSTALARAVTAIPGHACFGVFMGAFYGLAKKYDYAGDKAKMLFHTILSLLFPILLHGSYDYLATLEQQDAGWYFLAFIAVLFVFSYILVGLASKKDRPINIRQDQERIE